MRDNKIVYKGVTKKGLDIIVRYPVKEDLRILYKYINTLSDENTFIRLQGEKVSIEEEKKYLDTVLKKIENNQAIKLLVFHKNQLIGVGDINMEEKISSHVGIFGLTIAKEHRNQGMGKLLLKLVLNEAKKHLKSLRIVTLGVFSNNKIAIDMYNKFGFIQYGQLPKGIRYKNKFIDHIYMFKTVVGDKQ